MEIVNPEHYHQLVTEAQQASFSGWDFSWLEGRMIQEATPWDYRKLVSESKQMAECLLDLGTGGGEFLVSLIPLPSDTYAIESYPPNLKIAEENLAPLGVKIHEIADDDPLPFQDESFDLVISRHESFDPLEVFRVLKPGGTFITQQVGGLDNLELNQVLQRELAFAFFEWGLASALTGLYETDFKITTAQKAALTVTFLDIGAVVYYLKAIPWQVEGFDPETHAEGLIKLHNIIEREGKFVTTAHRFLIIAQKKAQPYEK